MALSPDGKRLYVATGRGNSVLVIDPIVMTAVQRIPTGSRPWYVALTDDGRKLYVANNLSNTISVIDTATLKVTKTIPAGDGPWGISVATAPAAP
jgi:YVTN family beta-propeller protein